MLFFYYGFNHYRFCSDDSQESHVCLFSDAKLSVPIFIISFLYLKLIFLIQPFFFSNINIQGYTLPSSIAITLSHKFDMWYSLHLNMPVLLSLWPYKCSEVRFSIIKHTYFSGLLISKIFAFWLSNVGCTMPIPWNSLKQILEPDIYQCEQILHVFLERL